MSRTITAHEATVKTATVEVKALTISGRQVTLSVFRQLKDEDLLDRYTADLRGVPWGIVNYFWGDCAKADTHLHVVWQAGEELRRACVFPNVQHTAGWHERKDDVDNWFRAWVLLTIAETGDLPAGTQRLKSTGSYLGSLSNRIAFWLIDRWVYVTLSDDERRLLEWVDPTPPEVRTWTYRGMDRVELTAAELANAQQEAHVKFLARLDDNRLRREEKRDAVRGVVDSFCGESRTDVLKATLTTDMMPDLIAFEQQWRKQYAALAGLDHLFIAV